MGKVAILIALAACSLSVNAHAQNLLAYWNMDKTDVQEKLDTKEGVQAGNIVMTAEPVSSFFGRLSNNANGTEINIVGEPGDPNQSLKIASVFNVGEEGWLIMSGIDMEHLTDLTLSFAVNSDATIYWNVVMHIDYRVTNDPDDWVDWDETRTTQDGVWHGESFALPDAVEGYTDVDLRIRITDYLTFGQSVSFDNIQITAVPEPGTWALLGGLGLTGLVIVRRRRA
jgi:hypothetical protein